MKSFGILAALSVLSIEVSGHYIFQQLTYGGTKYAIKQYIRPNTNYNSPIIDLTSNDLRCDEGGISGSGTDTISVAAGSSFSITTDTAVYHNGPIAFYLAKAPGAAADYDGSGTNWFKFWEKLPTFNPVTWPLAQTYTATLPAGLPSGEYLLRFEQLGLHNPYPGGIPQFYIGCAQISVTNGGSGTPGPLVAIPGHVKGNEPGYTVNIYNNFNTYTPVGPPVWTGGSGGSPATTTAGPATTTKGPVTTTKGPVTTTAGPVTTTRGPVTTPSTTRAATTTPASGGGNVPKYQQCGGSGWTGATGCVSGSTCTKVNDFYYQCL